MLRVLCFTFCLAAALISQAAVLSEDFSTDPVARGWRSFGDTSLFHWDATNRNLAVTWDSSRTNSFFYQPLGTVLAKSDDFSFRFDVRLSDIRIGSTPGKSNEFEIALGLLNTRSATNANAFRGAGASATYGVRNLIEFDYFPDAGFGDTFATTVVSTNNVFAFAHNFPLTLSTGDTFRITLTYTASNQLLRTSALRNGAPFAPLADVSLAGKPDFRVDAFAVISYSDAVQASAPAFHGSVLAHGTVDNVQLTLPPPPLAQVAVRRTNSLWRAEFVGRTNWVYTLEGSTNLAAWQRIGVTVTGTGGALSLMDTNAPMPEKFYRVRAERP